MGHGGKGKKLERWKGLPVLRNHLTYQGVKVISLVTVFPQNNIQIL